LQSSNSVNNSSNPQSSNSQSTNLDETTYLHILLATALAVSESEPKTFKQATSCADAPRWYTAMQEELDLMKEQDVWTVVLIPSSRHNIVDCRWVYKIKRDSAGQIKQYKARLVAKGFSQQPGTDFDEVFSPVVRYDSLRLLIALSISLGWKRPDQMDVKGAFLYGNLNKEIYMRLPSEYEEEGQCACLNRSIYGLKQSPSQWYQRLTGFLIPLGYVTAHFDPCILIHLEHKVIIAIYVDDITITEPNITQRENLKKSLKGEFKLSDLGSLNWLLGIEVQWQDDNSSVTLSQQAYIDQLLVRFGMDSCNPVHLPLNPDIKLFKAQDGGDLAEVSRYQQIIGSLMYLVIGTRPDLTYTVSALSQFSSKPTTQHMGILKQVLRYLKGTKNLTLIYRKSEVTLSGYSDSDYGGDRNDWKSTLGNIFQIAGNTISGRLVKQRCISTSMVEAEYIALSTTAKQQI